MANQFIVTLTYISETEKKVIKIDFEDLEDVEAFEDSEIKPSFDDEEYELRSAIIESPADAKSFIEPRFFTEYLTQGTGLLSQDAVDKIIEEIDRTDVDIALAKWAFVCNNMSSDPGDILKEDFDDLQTFQGSTEDLAWELFELYEDELYTLLDRSHHLNLFDIERWFEEAKMNGFNSDEYGNITVYSN